jgi:regulator of replication initiation timing
MQANAQKLWENAHKHLVDLLRLLDQDYDESCEKATRPLESFSDDDLAYLIHVRLRAMQGNASKMKKPDETIDIKQSLKELSQKYADLEQTLLASQDLNKKLQSEKSALEAHLAALRQIQKDEVAQDIQSPKSGTEESRDLMPVPDWVITWQSSKNFEKTSAAIFLMGEMGIALRPAIIKQMAKRLSLSAANKNLDEALNWLMSPEGNEFPILVEQISGVVEQGSSSGGNQPAVLHLTRDGHVAYQVLTGKIPKDNEFDALIRHHSSPEHTILNIQAGEILVDEGYRIQGRAQAISLSNGEIYIPDIIAVDPKTGEVIFVEVERDVSKDQVSRKTKWMKFYEASNGNLFVFCDNQNCQRAIQGEINLALNGLNYNSFLTNLHGLRNGKRAGKDGSIWFSQRRGNEK